MICCRDNRSWHVFHPFHGTWRCLDCCITPDYNADQTVCYVSLSATHRWVGHDVNGLMCFPPTAIDVATEHVCRCGAGRFVKPYTLREPELNSEPTSTIETTPSSEPSFFA